MMKKTEDQMLVIFGASGDLAKRKLLPSLFELFGRDLLPERFLILATARTVFTDEEYRREQRENLISRFGATVDTILVDGFLRQVFYCAFNTDDHSEYDKLRERIETLRQQVVIPDRIVFYMATPPVLYDVIALGLQQEGLNQAVENGGWRRIVVEKPFGYDLESAGVLNHCLQSVFSEEQIYRIDHYLGKETVQNILVLRFSNGIFEPLWNRNYIDYIEISATETLGVENRGRYYDGAGALRDMIQNHLMQLMAFVAMESPVAFDAESLRNEMVKVFRSLHPLFPEDVVFGQYTAGGSEGHEMRGYRDELGVAAASMTETYVAMRFFIDNWRWGGVPFYFHTGKCLREKKSEIIIHFKSTPHQFFVGACSGSSCNRLILRIQPDESISLKFGLKMPGAGFEVKQVSMDFRYDSLASEYLADAYERLLLDVMQGDSTLYTRYDALVASWSFIDPLIRIRKEMPETGFFNYPAGSEGPLERTRLFRHFPSYKEVSSIEEVCLL